MVALWIVGILALLIAALLLTRVGVTATYSEEGVELLAHFGLLHLRVYPRPEKSPEEKEKAEERRARRKKAKEEKKKKKKKTEPEEKKGGTVKEILRLLPIIFDALGRLRRKLTINVLTLHFLAAGEDPFQTAMTFGRVSAGAGVLLPLLENAFTVKQRDIRTAVSFTETENRVYIRAKLTLAIGSILKIGLIFLMRYLQSDKKDAAGGRQGV